jgi:hypothetical protein
MPLPPGAFIYPGSFNPLHEGHAALAAAAIAEKLQEGASPLVVFEIAVVNVDKPPLPREEILRRLKQFDPLTNPVLKDWNLTNIAVAVTSEPLFVAKARLFPRSSFIVGADTFVRLIDRKYYSSSLPMGNEKGGGEEREEDQQRRGLSNMVVALADISKNGCNFLVGGRIIEGGSGVQVFETMDCVLERSRLRSVLPDEVLGMFVGLSERQFRKDISSTELRQRRGKCMEVNVK